MKIFHVSSNKVWGGGEQYVLDLCRHLIADGYDVHVVCRNVGVLTERFRTLGTAVSTLPLRGITDAVSAWRMSRMLASAGRCVVHVHNFKDAFTAAYARRLSGNRDVRIVVTRHLVRRGKTSLPYRWLYRETDAIVFVSELARREFLSVNPPVDESKLIVVHNSIVLGDTTTEAGDLRAEYGIPDGSTLLMYHGRLAAEKGIDTLLQAVAETHREDIHLVMIGTGSDAYTHHIRTMADSLGIAGRVHLPGFRHDVIPYIRQADIGVMPSVVRESYLLSGLEYMSQQKCLITTDNGGQAEYVRHGINGLLCPPADAGALARTIVTAIDDVALRDAIGRQARADFETRMNYQTFYNNIRQKVYEPEYISSN